MPHRGAAPAEAPVGTAELESAIDTLARFVAGFEPGRFSGEDASVLVSWFTRCERLAGTAKALAASRASRAHRPEATDYDDDQDRDQDDTRLFSLDE